jgi:hypothetical protein
MPYSIETKDGISIQNIPDDIPADSQILKDRVAKLRAERDGQTQQLEQPQAAPTQTAESVEQAGDFKPLETLGNIGRQIIGGLETAGAVAGGIVAEPVAGIVGLAEAANPLTDPGAGAQAVETVRRAIGDITAPRTEAGKSQLAAVGEFIAPAVRAFTGAEEALGDSALRATGSPLLAAAAKTIPTLAGEILGIGLAKGVSRIGKPTASQIRIGELIQRSRPSSEILDIGDVLIAPGSKQLKIQSISDIAARSSDNHPAIAEINQIIESGGDASDLIEGIFETVNSTKGAANETARFLLNGAGRVAKDPLAIEAIKQGFDPGVIAAIKGSAGVNVAKLGAMVDILERGKANARVASEFRPSDIVGDSLLDRFKAVKKINSDAGKRLDGVAKSLKGQSVDFSAPISNFISDLGEMGIAVENVGGKFTGNFNGSIIEGLAAPEKAINRIVERLGRGGGNIDAFDVHRMKKFIDENVTFGKTKEGLGGKTEQLLKSLRRDLDGALDSAFPEYNAVNTQFSDTISALDNFKQSSGAKFDPMSPNADKFVGTLSRRLLSNAQSRVQLLDSAAQLQSVAKKHGARFDDDILTQAMFVDELQSVFGSSAKASFLGDIEKGVRTATGRRGLADVGIDAATEIAQKSRGINEKNAIKAIRNLLENRQ